MNLEPVPYMCAACGVQDELQVGGWGFSTDAITLTCANCGGEMRSVGVYVPAYRPDGLMLMTLEGLIGELELRPDGMPLSEVLRFLEEQAPEISPLLQWIREHQVELGLGIGAASLVSGILIALLGWVMAGGSNEVPPPAVPAGVTYEQMEELLNQFRLLEAERSALGEREHEGKENEQSGFGVKRSCDDGSAHRPQGEKFED